MKTKTFYTIFIIGVMLIGINLFFVPQTKSDENPPFGYNIIDDTVFFENSYAYLEVYPHTSNNIVLQTQYANITWKKTDNYVDYAFRFDYLLSTKNIWVWRNISHITIVNDYGFVLHNYSLYGISNFTKLINTPPYVDYGDIPSNNYYSGTVNNTYIIIGFDSFFWLNPQHTNAYFNYTTYDVTGDHNEQFFYFDWDNINNLFQHKTLDNKHYYFIENVLMNQNKTYKIKFQYNTEINTNGKWTLLAKLSNETLQEVLNNKHYVMIDPWWDTDYPYYKMCTLSNPLSGCTSVLKIGKTTTYDVSCGGHCQNDFDDIRFVRTDNTTELNFWMSNYTNGDYGFFWVNNSYGDTNILMYYGNPTCLTTSNGTNTFYLFDHFDTGSLNTLLWNSQPTITFPDSTTVKIMGQNSEIYSKTTYGYGYNFVSYSALCDRDASDGCVTHGFNNDWEDTTGTYIYSYRQNPTPGQLTGYSKLSGVGGGIGLVKLESLNYRTWETARNTTNNKLGFRLDLSSWYYLTASSTIPTSSLSVDLACRRTSDYIYCDWCFVTKWHSPEQSFSAFTTEIEHIETSFTYNETILTYDVNFSFTLESNTNKVSFTLQTTTGESLSYMDLDEGTFYFNLENFKVNITHYVWINVTSGDDFVYEINETSFYLGGLDSYDILHNGVLFDNNQFMTLILLIIGVQMILYGLKDDKKSGGFCVIFGGFSFLGVALVSFMYISVIGAIFVIFSVYFILTGINKTFFKKKGETDEKKKTT